MLGDTASILSAEENGSMSWIGDRAFDSGSSQRIQSSKVLLSERLLSSGVALLSIGPEVGSRRYGGISWKSEPSVPTELFCESEERDDRAVPL